MNETSTGTFIMLDGIDGSGKSTIISAWKDTLASQGKSVFELKSYWREHNAHPPFELLMEYDVIVSAEPTYVGVGSAIRTEMITHGSAYTATATAQAYALDRLILYTKLLVPLRAAGKCIIQDRGVSTSLCYQPIQGNITMEEVAAIEGNTYCLSHAPDVLVLAHIEPAAAIARLGARTEKDDNSFFEQASFLQSAHAVFHSDSYQSLFSDRGTQIQILDTSVSEKEMIDSAQAVLSNLVS